MLPCVAGLSWSTVVKTDLGSFMGEGATAAGVARRGCVAGSAAGPRRLVEAGARHEVSMVSGAVESEIDRAPRRELAAGKGGRACVA